MSRHPGVTLVSQTGRERTGDDKHENEDVLLYIDGHTRVHISLSRSLPDITQENTKSTRSLPSVNFFQMMFSR